VYGTQTKKKKTNVMGMLKIFGLDIVMLWARMLDLKLDIISPYHYIIIITIVHKLLCKPLFTCFLLPTKSKLKICVEHFFDILWKSYNVRK
jgi:hypothetical protein